MDDALLALLNDRCDIVAASAGVDRRPSVCWGMGCQVHEDRRTATIWLRRDQAADLVADVARTGRIAVVFEVPLTNVGVQAKGSDARVRDAMPSDAPRLRTHLANMVRELALVGVDEAFTRAAFEQAVDDLVAVEFTIDTLHEQTPGPRAGKLVRDTA